MDRLELDLEVYHGPFDLLFTLILKEEVDICEVDLVQIILTYLETACVAIDGVPADWEGLSEFLVLISSLLELKSRVLLPGAAPDETAVDPDEARELLLRRLEVYQTYKGAAAALAAAAAEQRGRLYRSAARATRRRRRPLEEVGGTHDPAPLAGALERLLQSRHGPDTSHVAVTQVDLTRQLGLIRRLLAQRGRLSFETTFGGEPPVVQAVSLFALLQLLSQGQVVVSQEEPFADITAEARTEARASA